MTTKNVTVGEFIQKYLIDQISDIRDKHPYFAFTLMAIGIEFLGQCINNKPKFNKGLSTDNYKLGLTIPPLNDVKYSNLYDNMRCGLAHSLLTKGGLSLSNVKNDGAIGSYEFYNDFTAACNEILSGNIVMPRKKLSDTFFVVTTTDDGTSTTATTTNNQVQQTK